MEPLTVEELIKKLQKCDPKAIVVKTTDNFEQGHNEVLASRVDEFKGGMIEQTFRDAFDDGAYFVTIVKRKFDNDKEEKGIKNFVKIP